MLTTPYDKSYFYGLSVDLGKYHHHYHPVRQFLALQKRRLITNPTVDSIFIFISYFCLNNNKKNMSILYFYYLLKILALALY